MGPWKVTDPRQLVQLFMWTFFVSFALVGFFYLAGAAKNGSIKEFWEYIAYATPSMAAIVAGGTFYLNGSGGRAGTAISSPTRSEYAYFLGAAALLLFGLGAFIATHSNRGAIGAFLATFGLASLVAFSLILYHERTVFIPTKHPAALWAATVVLLIVSISLIWKHLD